MPTLISSSENRMKSPIADEADAFAVRLDCGQLGVGRHRRLARSNLVFRMAMAKSKSSMTRPIAFGVDAVRRSITPSLLLSMWYGPLMPTKACRWLPPISMLGGAHVVERSRRAVLDARSLASLARRKRSRRSPAGIRDTCSTALRDAGRHEGARAEVEHDRRRCRWPRQAVPPKLDAKSTTGRLPARPAQPPLQFSVHVDFVAGQFEVVAAADQRELGGAGLECGELAAASAWC